jgi:hypothetical protein
MLKRVRAEHLLEGPRVTNPARCDVEANVLRQESGCGADREEGHVLARAQVLGATDSRDVPRDVKYAFDVGGHRALSLVDVYGPAPGVVGEVAVVDPEVEPG